MPLYEYVCRACDERFERLARTWNEAVTCPACEGQDVEKQVSAFALGGTPGTPSSGGCACGRGGCGCHP